MKYSPLQEIKVNLNFGIHTHSVGRLAINSNQIYFEYDRSFLEKNIEISPIYLPLQPGVKKFDPFLFEGLPGIFNDSLPDGWGRLLLDRSMRRQGIIPTQLSPLDRLGHVGENGIGALTYKPSFCHIHTESDINLDLLASYTEDVLNGEAEDVLQELLSLNGSSAGARPKAMIGVDSSYQSIIHGAHKLPDGYDPWIVKFANTEDGVDAGAIEYIYSLMAKEAGLNMENTYLFPSRRNLGYFATKRFDQEGSRRLLVHTACGLLHSDFRTPSLDYEDLLTLTAVLTKDVREVEKMFQLAVFNVLAHNRDDHAKNFSFLMNEKGEWKLSPAYDITFSSGPRGEQSTMVLGEGKSPKIEHLIKLGEKAKINKNKAAEVITQTQEALNLWIPLAKEYNVSSSKIKFIANIFSSTNDK